MRVERADFDDLVTLVTQAPPWEKDRAAGVRTLLRAIAEGKPDAPDQILARWTWRLARAVRKTLDRKASQEYQDGKRLLGALANSRGHRHEENAARLVTAALEMPREVGAALLASAEGYTPRVDAADRGRPRAARHDPGDRRRARRRPARAEDRPVADAAAPASASRSRRGDATATETAAANGESGDGQARRRRAEAPPPPAQAAGCAAPAPPASRGSRGRRRAPPSSRRRAPRNAARRFPRLIRMSARHRGYPRARDRPARDRLPGRGRDRDLARASCRSCRSCSPAARPGRKPLRIVTGLVASFVVFTLFAAWLLDKLGLPAGLPAQPRDRAALPRRGDAARAPARALDRAAVRAALALPRGRRRASCSASRSASSSCRAPGPVLAAVTVVAANNDVGWRAVAADARLRARRRSADGADRVRRPGARGRGCARTPSSSASRRAS